MGEGGCPSPPTRDTDLWAPLSRAQPPPSVAERACSPWDLGGPQERTRPGAVAPDGGLLLSGPASWFTHLSECVWGVDATLPMPDTASSMSQSSKLLSEP